MNSKELESKRPTLFLLGVISALSLTLMAFEWTSSRELIRKPVELGIETEFIEKTLAKIIIEQQQKDYSNNERQSQSLTQSNKFKVVPDNMPLMDKGPTLSVLKLKMPRRSAEKSLSRDMRNTYNATRSIRGLQAHELPYLRNCGHIQDDIERFQCTQVELRKHVVENFRMPSSDQIKDLPQRVEVTFTIDRFGLITNIVPDKDYHTSLTSEIDRVMGKLPEMVPATVSGQRIDVRFDLPILLERY